MRGHAGVWLAVVILGAGCLGSGDSNVLPNEPSLPGKQTDAPIDLETVNDAEILRTLDTAPTWQTGEWWRFRLTETFRGEVFEATRVAAGTEGDNFLVGMPRDDWVDALMVLHIPGFGEVSRDDLSFEIHDVRFEPLRFPLRDGDTWQTAFEGRPVEATVDVIDNKTAEVTLVGASDQITVTYDAEVGAITRFVHPTYASYEIIDHGFDYEGTITVPHMHDVVFQNFRIFGALTGTLSPAAPIDTVTVDETYDRVSFALIVGSIEPQTIAGGPALGLPPAGAFREFVTAPEGTTWELTVTAADPPGIYIKYAQLDSPGGDWTMEHAAAGAGLVGAEGIAYHVYDVDVPTGFIHPSTGEHEHGG